MPVDFDDMIPDVRTHLSGAPETTCIHYLRRAAQQFCEDSGLWQVSLGSDMIDPLTGDADYFEITIPNADFPLPSGAQLLRVSRVTFEDDEIEEISFDENTQKLRFPSMTVLQTGVLEVVAVLGPTDDADDVPNSIGRHRKAIADHAIYEMGMMPNQQWSMGPGAARLFMRSYNQRLAEGTVGKARKGAERRVKVPLSPF